jgi:hypothetical protein
METGMNSQKRSNQATSHTRQPSLPLGGALIDSQGREIPITEGMIRLACQSLEKSCVGAMPRG